MDQGSWLWKKKSGANTIVANDKTGFSFKGNQDEMLQYEKEAAPERSVKNLNEKLALLIAECNAKDDLVANHSKLTQEAIAGREKAEAEVINLNAALNDCMQRLSSTREEQDQLLCEAVMKTSKEFEKEYKKLENKLMETNRRLARLAYENSQLTDALLVKERLIEDASEQMSQATGEFKILTDRLDSSEKENGFLKYEFQMLENELEIRNNEMDLSRRSAEASEKKHLQSAKKLSKLEAECQRLRVLLRKRIPGSTSLANMKSEVEMQVRNEQMEMSREYCKVSDKRNRFMIGRLCEMEEENKILKEITVSKEDELRSLRTVFTLLASKLSQVEDEVGDHSESQRSISDDSRSWASALLCQLENFRQREIDSSFEEHKMIGGSEMSLMDDFAEMEKLAIASVDSQSENSCDNTGKELIPVNMESRELSTETPCEWLQNIMKAISEENRVSKRSIDDILEDIWVALKCTNHVGPTNDSETSKPFPVRGLITWNSLNGSGTENQVGPEPSIERLESELDSVLESKRLVEDQIIDQKLMKEELDTELSVSKSQYNDLLQKLSSLEVELEDRSHCCEELEAACLELQLQLQLQLESVSCKQLPKDNEKQEEKSVRTGWKITDASTKLAECQETIMNLDKQLREMTSPVKSTTFNRDPPMTNEKTMSQQGSSLRDRMLAEDGVGAEDPNSPKTKEIISSTETKIVPYKQHSSSGCDFYEAKTTVSGAVAIVPSKKRGGGSNFLGKLLFRRKKGNLKKKILFALRQKH